MSEEERCEQIIRRVSQRLFGDVGCSDGSCVFGHPGGMQTNGGCGCIKETNPVMLRRTIFQLREVAKVLAASCEVKP